MGIHNASPVVPVSPCIPLYQQQETTVAGNFILIFVRKKPLQSKAKGYRISPVGARLTFINNLRNGEAKARISTYNGMFVVCN